MQAALFSLLFGRYNSSTDFEDMEHCVKLTARRGVTAGRRGSFLIRL
jgi:hypothetical protein